jgi:hypothetical protein
MRKTMLGLSVVLVLLTASLAVAQETPHAATEPHATKPAQRPVLPEPSPMPGSVIILILGLFLAAASVGPAVRYHTPEEAPEPSSHDDHGHDAHDAHGHGH